MIPVWSLYVLFRMWQGAFFVKTARRPAAAMFEGEALGLEALRAAGPAEHGKEASEGIRRDKKGG